MLIAGSREPSQCFPLYWSLYLKRRGCLCANCLCLPNEMKNCQCLEDWFSWPVIFSPDCHAVLKDPFLMPENPTQLYSSPLSFFPLSLQIPVCVFNVFTTPLSLLSLALPFLLYVSLTLSLLPHHLYYSLNLPRFLFTPPLPFSLYHHLFFPILSLSFPSSLHFISILLSLTRSLSFFPSLFSFLFIPPSLQ